MYRLNARLGYWTRLFVAYSHISFAYGSKALALCWVSRNYPMRFQHSEKVLELSPGYSRALTILRRMQASCMMHLNKNVGFEDQRLTAIMDG
jgi:uncharacterized membrane protein YdcZ (DUF606 family)